MRTREALPRRRVRAFSIGPGKAVILGLAVLLGVTACRGRAPRVDANTLCALAEEAARSGRTDALLAELARQTGTSRERLRTDRDGVYAPSWHFFVEEAGIFVARPGAVIPTDSGDPSFTRVDSCIYTYEAKG